MFKQFQKTPKVVHVLLLTICVMVSIQSVNAEWTTPTDGEFFYTKLDFVKGQSFVQFGVGSDNEPVNLKLNTEELTLGVFTTNCSIPYSGFKCDVPDPYDPRGDEKKESNSSTLTYEKAYLFDIDNAGIKAIDMSGIETITDVNVTLPQFDCQYSFRGHIFEVIQINQAYKSSVASGFIGLAPYTAVENNQGTTQRVSKNENFLWKLQDEHNIDHQIISIYMNQENTDKSFVKFGGYDAEGFEDSNNIIKLDTMTKDSWSVQGASSQVQQGDQLHTEVQYNVFIIEPAYPFIYLPVNLYRDFKNFLNSQNKFTNVQYSNQRIHFTQSCDWVKQQDFDMKFNVFIDASGSNVLTLELSDLLVPSEVLDSNNKGECFLGFMPSDGAKDPTAIYLGQLYLEKYYTYFDISGYFNEQMDTLRIGTGIQNKNANILQNQYIPDENGSNMHHQDRMQCAGQQKKPRPDGDQADGTGNADGESGSSTTTIILAVGGVLLAAALGAIFYCKCRKGADVNDGTPIGENLKKDNSSINPDTSLDTSADRTQSQDQNLNLLTADGMENI